MNTKSLWRYGWALAAIIASPLAAQEPMMPQPVLPAGGSEIAPAVMLPPMSAPAPIVYPKANTASEIEQVGRYHPARLNRPIAVGSQPMVAPTAAWPNLATPNASASAAPQWRWYGWGAANAAGSAKAGPSADGLNVLPGPTPASEPAKSPTTKPTGISSEGFGPEPNWNPPPKPLETTLPINNDPPAPTLTPPNLEMQLQPPKPSMKPNMPTSVDPWTGIGPTTKALGSRTEVVASSSWTTARASGSR